MPQLNPQMAEILALNAAAMKDRPARVTLSAGRGAGADERHVRGVLERGPADALGGVQLRDPGSAGRAAGPPV